MKRRDGFTLIELLITVTIMVILLTLSVVALRSSLANGRDEKRKTDVEAIARGLERRYNDGNPRATASVIEKGAYPGVNEMLHAMGWDRADFDPIQIVGGYLPDLLPGVNRDVLTTPSGGVFNITCVWACAPAGDQATIDGAVSTDNYSYEPVGKNGEVCSNAGCRAFNIYYRTETDGGIIHVVRSKNQ